MVKSVISGFTDEVTWLSQSNPQKAPSGLICELTKKNRMKKYCDIPISTIYSFLIMLVLNSAYMLVLFTTHVRWQRAHAVFSSCGIELIQLLYIFSLFLLVFGY